MNSFLNQDPTMMPCSPWLLIMLPCSLRHQTPPLYSLWHQTMPQSLTIFLNSLWLLSTLLNSLRLLSTQEQDWKCAAIITWVDASLGPTASDFTQHQQMYVTDVCRCRLSLHHGRHDSGYGGPSAFLFNLF